MEGKRHPLEHPRIAEFRKAQKGLQQPMSLEEQEFTLTEDDRRAISDIQTHLGCEALIKALTLRHKMFLRKWYTAGDDDFAQAIRLKAACAEIDWVVRLLTDKPPKKEKDENAG